MTLITDCSHFGAADVKAQAVKSALRNHLKCRFPGLTCRNPDSVGSVQESSFSTCSPGYGDVRVWVLGPHPAHHSSVWRGGRAGAHGLGGGSFRTGFPGTLSWCLGSSLVNLKGCCYEPCAMPPVCGLQFSRSVVSDSL